MTDLAEKIVKALFEARPDDESRLQRTYESYETEADAILAMFKCEGLKVMAENLTIGQRHAGEAKHCEIFDAKRKRAKEPGGLLMYEWEGVELWRAMWQAAPWVPGEKA